MDEITEDQARQMEAGPELDRICAEWMGWEEKEVEWRSKTAVYLVHSDPSPGLNREYLIRVVDNDSGEIIFSLGDEQAETFPPSFSTKWSAAGPLLEAMDAKLQPNSARGWQCDIPWEVCGEDDVFGLAPTPQLAIARACAVLVTRGINRGELEN